MGECKKEEDGEFWGILILMLLSENHTSSILYYFYFKFLSIIKYG